MTGEKRENIEERLQEEKVGRIKKGREKGKKNMTKMRYEKKEHTGNN